MRYRTRTQVPALPLQGEEGIRTSVSHQGTPTSLQQIEGVNQLVRCPLSRYSYLYHFRIIYLFLYLFIFDFYMYVVDVPYVYHSWQFIYESRSNLLNWELPAPADPLPRRMLPINLNCWPGHILCSERVTLWFRERHLAIRI